jgi:hypothetical protein
MALYDFSTVNCATGGAPKAVPGSGVSISSNSSNYVYSDSAGSSGGGAIDVVNDFQWTVSPPGASSRQEVPNIELREKRLRTNSYIAAAAYYLASGASSTGTILGRAAGMLGQSGSSITSALNSPALQSVAGLGNITAQGIEQTLLNFGSGLTTGNSSVRDLLSQNAEGLGSQYLKPYEGLYLTEDTGFFYNMPYFSDEFNTVNNAWSEQDMTGESLAKQATDTMYGAAMSLARFANFTEPGVYIERPKFFNFVGTGETIAFTFPLINTGYATYADISKNWQLCFLLVYQNRPNRRSRELIDPPAIYEVTIPGVRYMPYAYISRLNIGFKGARRQMGIDAPPGGVTSIVPDAFEVSITLTGLVPESKNFLYASLGDKQNLTDVVNYNTFNPFGEIYNSFVDSFATGNANINSLI